MLDQVLVTESNQPAVQQQSGVVSRAFSVLRIVLELGQPLRIYSLGFHCVAIIFDIRRNKKHNW